MCASPTFVMDLAAPVEVVRYLSSSPVPPTVSPLTTPPHSPYSRSEGDDSQATIEETALGGNESQVQKNASNSSPDPQTSHSDNDFDPRILNELVRSAEAKTLSRLRLKLIEQLVYDTIMLRQAHRSIGACVERRRQFRDLKHRKNGQKEKRKVDELIDALENSAKQDTDENRRSKRPRLKIICPSGAERNRGKKT